MHDIICAIECKLFLTYTSRRNEERENQSNINNETLHKRMLNIALLKIILLLRLLVSNGNENHSSRLTSQANSGVSGTTPRLQ